MVGGKVKNQSPYDSAHEFVHYLTIVFLWFVLKILFFIEIKGKENIPKDSKSFILASNHVSYYDPVIISLSLSKPVAYIAKQELFKINILKELILFYGAIPIKREKPSPSSLKQFRKAVLSNWVVGIFIEGTRNKSKNKKIVNLEQGAAFLARFGGNLKIVPMGIDGSGKIFKKIKVKIGKPIEFDRALSLDSITKKCGLQIAKLSNSEAGF